MIRRLFRAAVKAVMRRDANPQPKPRRRSGGETRHAFGLAKAMLRRAVSLPPEAYAAATGFLSDALDWFDLWWRDDTECSSEYVPDTEHLSPHP